VHGLREGAERCPLRQVHGDVERHRATRAG
jgi:hypothetical protein